LLVKNPRLRIGSTNGITEILEHPFFSSINKNLILDKKIKQKFIPHFDKDLGLNNFDKEITDLTIQMTKISDTGISLIQRNRSLFKNFV